MRGRLTEASVVELCNLVETEINLGLTFLAAAQSAGSEEQRQQAYFHVIASYESVDGLLHQVPVMRIDPLWLKRLAEMKNALNVFLLRRRRFVSPSGE